jgi:SAM-dependent methyltransferase
VSTSKVRADFDRIAALSADGWSHNSHYHPFLLKHLPPSGAQALDVGCGTGGFSRLLAQRFRRVLAVDLSPRMVELARERSPRYPNVDFQVADAMACEFPAGQFDCVASIATLHHLPFEGFLSRVKNALVPGGTLLVLDLFQPVGFADRCIDLLAVPVSVGLRLVKGGRLREPPKVRAAWEEHGRSDVYLTMAEIRRSCAAVLPGAQVKRHLLWRYSIVWRKEQLQS